MLPSGIAQIGFLRGAVCYKHTSSPNTVGPAHCAACVTFDAVPGTLLVELGACSVWDVDISVQIGS